MSRYIKLADALRTLSDTCYLDEIDENMQKLPSIDIVRCQDCKYWVYNFNGCSRNPCVEPWYATDGCTYGERSEM